MTGSACRFWRGLCVRAGSMLARRVSQVLWSTPPPGSQARVKPKAQAAGEAGLDLSKEHLRTQELESCAPVADTFGLSFLREGSGGGVRPLSRHHVGNRACVAARPGKEDTPANPSLVTGISWGVSGVVDGNAGTVSSFPARTTVARHDRFCLQVLAWLVRPCGFDACPSCVSSSWSTPPPGSQARVKPKASACEAGLDLSKEHLENTGTRIVCYLRNTFPSSGNTGTAPESRRKPGSSRQRIPSAPHLLRGLAGGLRVVDGNATVSSSSTDNSRKT